MASPLRVTTIDRRVDPNPVRTVRQKDGGLLTTKAQLPLLPDHTAIQPGTGITVVNQDSPGHIVTIPRLEIDKGVAGDESVSFTVERTGKYDYVCAVHPPGMVGRLVVTDG